MPRTTTAAARRSRPSRPLAIGAGVMMLIGVTTACAVVGLEPSTPLPEAVDAPAKPATPATPAPSAPATAASDFTSVPLPQGVSMWQTALPDGGAVYFVADRSGDDITTARVGMGGPRCFFGVAQDGVLQGRYRVITAGSGLDRQADPVRVRLVGTTLTLTERATGANIGEYQAVDPADVDAVAAGQAALATCGEVRAAPATATPR